MLAALFAAVFALVGCSDPSTDNSNNQRPTENAFDSPNILLIIADDLGLDAFSAYGVGQQKAQMPNLEKLAHNGLRFHNFWAYPTCTPTRSSIITGKHAFRTQVRQVGDVLSTNETILQKFIDEKTNGRYSSAVIGKWHLSEDPTHPNTMGLNHYCGLLSGGVRNYNSWKLTENGRTTRNREYITTKFTDMAIDWLNKQDKPWFLWLAYTAVHTPFHLPPSHLHSHTHLIDDENAIQNNPLPYYLSMIESLDTEIGRLLRAIPPTQMDKTVVIFIGDNGSPSEVAQTYEKRKVKGSIYQGGINVPLVVSGAHVTRVRQVEHALVSSTDLFATIAELAGTGVRAIHDSKSIVPLMSSSKINHRDFIYSELAQNNRSGYTIRNGQYKYIQYNNTEEELYDLIADPFEKNNLIKRSSMELQQAKRVLIEEVNRLRN
ncbi:MAG: sulfatase-like hydrolase/transferase [Myxococcota bacterium]